MWDSTSYMWCLQRALLLKAVIRLGGCLINMPSISRWKGWKHWNQKATVLLSVMKSRTVMHQKRGRKTWFKGLCCTQPQLPQINNYFPPYSSVFQSSLSDCRNRILSLLLWIGHAVQCCRLKWFGLISGCDPVRTIISSWFRNLDGHQESSCSIPVLSLFVALLGVGVRAGYFWGVCRGRVEDIP